MKFNDSLWLFVVFSSSSVNNISLNGVKQVSIVFKQLDFSFFGSVFFKNGIKMSLKCVVLRFVLDIVNSVSFNSSRRFFYNGFGDIELVVDFLCSFIIIDEF